MKREEPFTLSAVGLGLVAATLAQSFARLDGRLSVRQLLLSGLAGTAALALASWLASVLARRYRLFGGDGAAARIVGAAFLLWFGAELVRTVFQAQEICSQQFSSGALWGLLPLLVLAGWRLDGSAFNHTSRILWWLVLGGALICIAGLGGQMRWQRLFDGSGNPAPWALPALPVYPEYFALPLLCAHQKQGKGALLPFWSFAVQLGYALGVELLFGRVQGNGYTGLELLRAWTLGVFSRLDALLVLVWLAASLYRICFLLCVLRLLWRKNFACTPRAAQEGKC